MTWKLRVGGVNVNSLHEAGELRRRYITALQEAEATDDFIKGPPAKAVSHLD